MIFNSEEDAYQYWEEAYSLSGDVAHLDRREQLFNDWVDDQAVSWIDEDTQQFIREWDRANQEDALIRTIDAFEQFVSYSEMSEFAVPGEVDTILMKLLKLRDEMYP